MKRVLHLKTIFSDISHTYESLLKETEVVRGLLALPWPDLTWMGGLGSATKSVF